MKQLIIYFGKQNESVLGFGTTADTIKGQVDDNFDIINMLSHQWASININNGVKYINTNNILWIDLVEVKDNEERN